jgi:eukaryotic translation initiation factor 2C
MCGQGRYSFLLVSIIFLLYMDKNVTVNSNSFFLQSHAAIKGTARPAYYFVLQDDARMPSAQLQKLVHALCFTYARSACSVSYATPAYYADRLCDRIRILFVRWLSGKEQIPEPVIGQMNAMGVQATREDVGWDRFRQRWSAAGPDGNPWHARLNNKMFWL